MKIFADSQAATYSASQINSFEREEEKRRQRSLALWIAMTGGRMGGNHSSGSSGGGRSGSQSGGVVGGAGGSSGSTGSTGGIPAL